MIRSVSITGRQEIGVSKGIPLRWQPERLGRIWPDFTGPLFSTKVETALFSVDVHFPKMDVKPLPAGRQGTNPVGSAIPFRSPHQNGKLRIPNDSITTIYLSTKPAEDQDIFDLYIKDETDAIGQLRWTSTRFQAGPQK